jgi:beta-phosphoglucomutase
VRRAIVECVGGRQTRLVIEDAPHGVEAARRAGMKCIALTTTYGRGQLRDADWVVDAFAAIDAV